MIAIVEYTGSSTQTTSTTFSISSNDVTTDTSTYQTGEEYYTTIPKRRYNYWITVSSNERQTTGSGINLEDFEIPEEADPIYDEDGKILELYQVLAITYRYRLLYPIRAPPINYKYNKRSKMTDEEYLKKWLTIKYDRGQPCKHPKCLSHISHPCEGCGRIAGNGIIYDPKLPLIRERSI